MSIFHARELLTMTPHQMLNELPNKLTVAFEDGISVDTSKRKVIYSNYVWEILRYYNKTPILSIHLVDSVLKGELLNSGTHIDLLSAVCKTVIETYQLYTPESKEHLNSMIYKATQDIDDNISKLAEADVMSIDILDLIEVINHPEIKNIKENIEPNSYSISKAYENILRVIKTDTSLQNNNLVKAVRSKMVNANQILQCIGVRGFPTEVDGTILPTPILTNYTEGLNTLYDFVAESRSAAKALYFSEAPLQDAEYFARRLQLLTMTVERIDYVDCGTKKHHMWRIKPPQYDDKGNMIYPGDLKFMAGKHYLNEQTEQYMMLSTSDTHLNDTVIKMRSVLHCEHPDPHKVCAMCFGGLSRNVSRFANLGHVCGATMTQQTSQSVLSTKHLDASSVSANIILSPYMRNYFLTNKEKNSYLVKPEFKGKSAKIVIPRDDASGLTDIPNIESVDIVNPLRISSISSIDFTYVEKGKLCIIPMEVNQENRKAILTYEMLKYLKEHRWETDQRGNFVLNLDHWDYSQPVMTLPDMEYSYSDHSHQIAKMIESSVKNLTDRDKPNSPTATLEELFVLVNSKLNVNIAALEVIVYATMVPDRESYSLARNEQHAILGVADQIIKNRSESAALAYEEVAFTLTNARSFFKMDRPDSVFDVFIAPNQVVQQYKQLQ